MTPRQLEVFQLVAKGLSNKEICDLLGISANTVKIHVAAILRSLGVSNRTEAAFAYQQAVANPSAGGPASDIRFVDRVGRPSVALLPLDLIAEPTRDLGHLVRGLEEELVGRLATWQWFPVVSMASARHGAKQHEDPVALGATLGARYLVSASLRANDSLMRATIHLVESDRGSTLWSESFDFEQGELFSVQKDIAKKLIAAVAPELIAAEANLSRYRSQAELTVWDNVCMGAWHMHRMTPEDSLKALECFDAAIEQDDAFGLAYSGRVSTQQMRLYQQWSGDREATVHDLLASAQSVLRLEPKASFAHSSAGFGHILLGDRKQAIEHLQTAVELNPSSTTALNTLGQAYGMSGRLDDCIMHMEDLLRIDPYSSSSYIYHNVLGMCHYLEKRYDEGVKWSESSLRLNPRATGAYVSMIAAHVEAGRLDEARVAVQALYEAAPEFRLRSLFDMMQAFTQPEMLDRIGEAVAEAGIRQ